MGERAAPVGFDGQRCNKAMETDHAEPHLMQKREADSMNLGIVFSRGRGPLNWFASAPPRRASPIPGVPAGAGADPRGLLAQGTSAATPHGAGLADLRVVPPVARLVRGPPKCGCTAAVPCTIGLGMSGKAVLLDPTYAPHFAALINWASAEDWN